AGLRALPREPFEQARPSLERACVPAETDEPRAALLMIDDHGPIVDTDRELGHVDVGDCDARQALEATAEVIPEIADRPAAKRQVVYRRTALAELRPEQRERRARRVHGRAAARRDLGALAARAQRDVRIRRHDVVAPARTAARRAVEPNRPRQIGERAKPTRDVVGIFELRDARRAHGQPPRTERVRWDWSVIANECTVAPQGKEAENERAKR